MKAYACCILNKDDDIIVIEHIYTDIEKAKQHKELFDEECFIAMSYMKIIEVKLD